MFTEIINRSIKPIPWDDPDFSRRMLNEHLTQEHDLTSRRGPIISLQMIKLVNIIPLRRKE